LEKEKPIIASPQPQTPDPVDEKDDLLELGLEEEFRSLSVRDTNNRLLDEIERKFKQDRDLLCTSDDEDDDSDTERPAFFDKTPGKAPSKKVSERAIFKARRSSPSSMPSSSRAIPMLISTPSPKPGHFKPISATPTPTQRSTPIFSPPPMPTSPSSMISSPPPLIPQLHALPKEERKTPAEPADEDEG
jgi:hypothetical protein